MSLEDPNGKKMPNRISMVSDILEGVARWSRRGVPHIVVGHTGLYGSATYFKSVKKWKFFYPYAAGEQRVKTFPNSLKLIEYELGGTWREELKEELTWIR